MDVTVNVDNLSAPLLVFVNEVHPLPLLNPYIP
jgi:hypothetical protein